MNQEEYAVMLHGLELTQEEVNRRIEARFPNDVHERALPEWSDPDAEAPALGTAEGLAAYIHHRGNYEVTTDHDTDSLMVTNMTTGRRYLVSRAYWNEIHTDGNRYRERVRLGEAIQNETNPRPDETAPAPVSPQPYLDAPIQYVQGGNIMMPYTATAQPLTPETFRVARDRILNQR